VEITHVTHVVYSLACEDGPPCYIGSTRNALRDRVQCHWNRIDDPILPVSKWLSQFKTPRHLRVDVICSMNHVCWSSPNIEDVERVYVQSLAKRLLMSSRVLSLNVKMNPFRISGGRRSTAIDNDAIIRCIGPIAFVAAEDVCPYELNAMCVPTRAALQGATQ